MIDVVLPDENEEDFMKMAVRLGFSSLCFVYDKPTKLKVKSDKLELFSGVLTKEKKSIDADLVLVKASGDDRFFFEKSSYDLIFDLELYGRTESMHSRNSGLDQVNCKLANQNYKLVALNFSSVLNNKGMKRSRILGRMMQNVRFCRKFKVRSVIASFASDPYSMRSPHDLKAFGISLGMHPSEAKLALTNVYDKIKHNIKKKSPDYISEGVEIVK